MAKFLKQRWLQQYEELNASGSLGGGGGSVQHQQQGAAVAAATAAKPAPPQAAAKNNSTQEGPGVKKRTAEGARAGGSTG